MDQTAEIAQTYAQRYAWIELVNRPQQMFRVAYRTTKQPTDGLAMLAGYCWAALRHIKQPVSAELMRFQSARANEEVEEHFSFSHEIKKVDDFRLISNHRIK